MDRVCYFEVPFDEPERMQNFYKSVFGWNFAATPGNDDYHSIITTEMDESYMPKEPGGINGGAYARADVGPSRSPVIVIEVESCEQRIKDVEAAGGSNILGPHQVGEMGIYAQVQDTEGNIIGLWQPLAPTQ